MDNTRFACSLKTEAVPNGCLPGTLIHTKNGLIPIEEIRLGDWLLSQIEATVASTPVYRQVLKTFVFEEKEVFLFRCYKPSGKSIEQLIVTRNQPFWVAGIGWTRADEIDMGHEIELADGTVAITLCATPIYRTAEDGIGWVTGAWGAEANNGAGNLVYLRDGSIIVGTEDNFNSVLLNQQGRYAHYHARVFNIDVDECHTYFIGIKGVWVRNV